MLKLDPQFVYYKEWNWPVFLHVHWTIRISEVAIQEIRLNTCTQVLLGRCSGICIYRVTLYS
jgi:hypothetical protein